MRGLQHAECRTFEFRLAQSLLACSGLSPSFYSVLIAFGGSLWVARNDRLRRVIGAHRFEDLQSFGTNTSDASGALTEALLDPAAREDYGVTLTVSIIHFIPMALTCFVICYQRDSLTRQNFVVLQLVKRRKDRTISELRGEKRQLEVIIAVDRAQSEAHAAIGHIKLVMAGQDRTLRPEAGRGTRGDAPSQPSGQPRAGHRTGSGLSQGGRGWMRDVMSQHSSNGRTMAGNAAQVASPASPDGSSGPAAGVALCTAGGMADGAGLGASGPSGGTRGPPRGREVQERAREARLVSASEAGDAARDEIRQLTRLADEEMDDVDMSGCLSSHLLPSHASGGGLGSTGRELDWLAREHSPHSPEAKLLRPIPITGTGTTTREGAEPHVSIEDGDAETAPSLASPFAFLSGRGFRMPSAHQEEVREAAAQARIEA